MLTHTHTTQPGVTKDRGESRGVWDLKLLVKWRNLKACKHPGKGSKKLKIEALAEFTISEMKLFFIKNPTIYGWGGRHKTLMVPKKCQAIGRLDCIVHKDIDISITNFNHSYFTGNNQNQM
jgi:hypothetical protein